MRLFRGKKKNENKQKDGVTTASLSRTSNGATKTADDSSLPDLLNPSPLLDFLALAEGGGSRMSHEEFQQLAICVSDIDAQDLEQKILETPHDSAIQDQLLTLADTMKERYHATILSRISKEGRTPQWLYVTHKYIDSFRKIHEAVWEEILNAEQVVGGMAGYSKSMAKVAELAANPSITHQPQAKFPDLYVQAATIKPRFDALVHEIVQECIKLHKDISLRLPDTLKHMSRVIEKSLLQEKGNLSGIKDIVRATMIGKSMAEIQVVVDILIGMHNARKCEIVRVKERFIKEPTYGGWRKATLNICLTDNIGIKHICEIQVVHCGMLEVAEKRNGFQVYHQYRNALEMVSMCRDTTKVTDDIVESLVETGVMDNIVKKFADNGVRGKLDLAEASVAETVVTMSPSELSQPIIPLAQRSCRACSANGKCADVPLLREDEISMLHSQICPTWTVSDDKRSLSRVFVAKNFKAALAALTAYGELAELENHHPDLSIKSYRTVIVDLSTHAVGGLTEMDFIVAAKCDLIKVDYSPKWKKEFAAMTAASH